MATILSSGHDLAQAVRLARQEQGLTQAELARDARVGRQWLVEFEAGDKPSAPVDMVLRVLKELRLGLTLGPAAPVKPSAPAAAVPVIRADDVVARHTAPGR
ncbi:MAG: helix-turn-helix transcriptional regulator [Propionibacteriaceae bacterium]|jgi:transcriptional regulator with XRE-family HTH domain|nr:helix-turn-helix transcriptional regulator [Propionibacteriaceae bacterium]